ncbi:MAG: hypothetical protein ACXABY_08570 [Candidatus Thorarchaeota archaeon]|jgi:hypothetical protein
MIVCNFTPDTVEWMHVGIIGYLKPGDIKEFDDARGSHILNKWGPRGILRYSLDADPDAVRKEAVRIYKRFWMNQIVNFNQTNEARKNENKAYNFPTSQLEEKAEELGVELVAPHKTQQKTESGQVAELKAENEELRGQVNDLKEGMTEILSIMKEIREKPAVPHVIDTSDLIRQFVNLGKDRYANWVNSHLEDLKTWPDVVVEKAKEKWEAFYKGEAWPLS